MSLSKQKLTELFYRYIGYMFVIGFLVGGYLYNVKFIQLGITDLGKNQLHLPSDIVAGLMALLAILTCVIAIPWGIYLMKLKWGLHRSIDVIIIVGLVQMTLTIWAPFVASIVEYAIWIICTSVVLGIGIPISFPLVYELIPTKHRGMVAGLITGLTYLVANLSPFEWNIKGLTLESLLMLIPGVAAFLVIRMLGLLKKWMPERTDYTEYTGRFSIRPVMGVVCLMFVIFFVDSLGFLRVIDTPELFSATWHGELGTRAVIGIVHFLAGIGVGYLYSKTDEWTVGLLALGLFVIADILFALYSLNTALAIACLYATAVSTYTVNNFAMWADVSTRENASKNAALGIGIGGWASSFLSTYLAMVLTSATTFSQHLVLPAIIAAGGLLIFSLLLKNKRNVLLGNEIRRSRFQ